MKLHLGCGQDYKPGFINVDCQKNDRIKPDVVVDLNDKVWPWPDNSVDYIYSSHVFEHLCSRGNTMMNCYRILKPGGRLEFRVPYAMSVFALADPTHESLWTEGTISYFLLEHRGTIPSYFGETWFKKIKVELLDQGVPDVWGRVAPTSATHRLRNLVPKWIRMILHKFWFTMFDEVYVILEKP